jgi:hypothetical protein
MSVLSTIHATFDGPVVEPEEQVLFDIEECSRLVFMLVSEATYEHKGNFDYFRVSLPLFGFIPIA